MGIKGIRTALKVDLDKPASEQPGLHVSSYIPTLVIKGSLLNHR
jgi:formamidase